MKLAANEILQSKSIMLNRMGLFSNMLFNLKVVQRIIKIFNNDKVLKNDD
jgi:hypothetical protein